MSVPPKYKWKTMFPLRFHQWIIDLQISVLYYEGRANPTPEQTGGKKFEELEQIVYVDPKDITCPRCGNTHFESYNYTDEHDNYLGLKCNPCGLQYSISH